MFPHLLIHLLGLDNPNFAPALFWAGPAGSIGLLGGLGVFLRHKTCKEPHCWRLGHVRHGVAQSALLCGRHHERALLAAPPADPQGELLAHVDALGQAVTGLSEQIAGLAEVVRIALDKQR